MTLEKAIFSTWEGSIKLIGLNYYYSINNKAGEMS